MAFQIKPILEANFEDFAKIQQRAYAGAYTGTPEEREQMIASYTSLLTCEGSTLLGVYQENQLVAGFISYDFTLNFHGELVKASGIGTVAVDLLHKKRGIAKTLLNHWLENAKLNKVKVCSLYPFNAAFYKAFGFGYGRPISVYHIPPAHFKKSETTATLRWGNLEDLTHISDCYDTYFQQTHGMKARTPNDLNKLKRQKQLKLIEVLEGDQVTGYLFFEQKALDPRHFLKQKLVIGEMITTTPESLKAICNFLNGQADQVDYIQWHTHQTHLYQLLSDITFASEPQVLPLISHKLADQGLGLMWQALDYQGLLDHFSQQVTMRVDFQIAHGFTGKTELVTLNGNLVDRVEIALENTTFSSFLMGCISLREAYQLGLIKVTQGLEILKLLKLLDQQFDMDGPVCLTRF